MGARWGMLVTVAMAASLAVVVPNTPVLLGFLAAVGGIGVASRNRARAGSRWRRGWWAVALAAPFIGLSAIPLAVVGGASAVFGAVGATLVLVGMVGARPVRDAAQARELLVQASLAGLVTAYLAEAVIGAVGDGAIHLHASFLVALAAEVAALTVTLQHVRTDRDTVTAADRFMLASLGMLVLTRLVAVLGQVTDGRVGPATMAAGTGAALGLLILALCSRQIAERVPVGMATDDVLRAAHVSLVVVGVLAGPVVITIRSGWRDDGQLLELAGAGALLALLSVLHLVQLVRDHGHRAWRARHDALTALPTEPLFHDRLEQAIVRARRTGSGLAVAFVDLDGFKRVNDRDGHEAGDEVLRTVAARLRDSLREQDTVARKSGDEFLVLLPDVEGPAAAEVVAAKLVAAVREPVDVGCGVHRVGASVGLSLWPRDGDDADELIRNADAAMYDVKEKHGGAVRWYTRETNSRTRLRLTLAAQLEAALDDPDQLDIAYQPRIGLRDGRVEGLVALVRWHHRHLGLITPRSFLPLAAEAGLSRALDLTILERAAREMARWRASGWCDVPVTVHVADPHVGHPDLEQDVVDILRRTGLPADRLQLAITETGLGRGGETGLATVRDLAETGVATFVSRFGTGAISLGMLAEAGIAAVELASTHVAPKQGGTSSVVRAALAVAEQLELRPVVNGVATAEQLERLRAAGCRAARGPHMVPPMLSGPLSRRLAELTGRGDHVPRAPLRTSLLGGAVDAEVERPGVASVLASAVGTGHDIEERALREVLALIGGPPQLDRRGSMLDQGVSGAATGLRTTWAGRHRRR